MRIARQLAGTRRGGASTSVRHRVTSLAHASNVGHTAVDGEGLAQGSPAGAVSGTDKVC
jgi:hypothetical protein